MIIPSFWGKWFVLQIKFVKVITLKLMSLLKNLSQLFSSTFLESNYLIYRLSYSVTLYSQLVRIGYIITWISIVIIIL
jgi:hypothetical protein